MSIDVTPSRSLSEYVTELVARTDRAEATAGRRLRDVVGGRSARIGLDDEAVVVRFDGERLDVVDAKGQRIDGDGRTDRATVLDILDAYLEVTDALTSGRIATRGDATAVAAMLHAIEILLDVATRAPALQALADDFRRDAASLVGVGRRHVTPSDVDRSQPDEVVLLARLDLLPD